MLLFRRYRIEPVQVPEIKVAEVARPTIKPQQSSDGAQQQAQPAPRPPQKEILTLLQR